MLDVVLAHRKKIASPFENTQGRFRCFDFAQDDGRDGGGGKSLRPSGILAASSGPSTQAASARDDGKNRPSSIVMSSTNDAETQARHSANIEEGGPTTEAE